MGVRVKRVTHNADIVNNPIPGDWNQEQRETTVDGYTFHWGPNEVRNFLDEGVGAAHAAQLGSPSIVREDATAFGSSRF